jgi:hypothetical protein
MSNVNLALHFASRDGAHASQADTAQIYVKARTGTGSAIRA